MPAPGNILDLVERFERNRDDYHSPNYNEARLRIEFIDPLFKALGWDIDNVEGHAEAYKDVIHEDSLRVEQTAKAPDYCFRVGGQRKFFVEAKKPAVDIREDSSPAYQLRRYAWSAKLPLSILTDFEEFAVYDCRIKPEKVDKASTARVKFIKCSEYADRWDEIAGVFSRDAILKGAFDKFAESTKKKRGTAQVDDAFLEEIESWRDMLARNIALRNPGLSMRELNFAVQATIDRIVFLRICEGRGIEEYGALMALQNGVGTYPRLMELFRKADFRYNSGLFHFDPERGRPDPDTVTPKLTIDDKILKDILKRLYYPDSPYEFSMIPPDILGQVYERFLGKVIRLTPSGMAKVEDKPEVRKAGGVYYTPTYIVDYIVEHTVGKLVEGKKPKDVSRLRVLDPACGSGSFLLGAYQYLLDWYLDAHTKNDPEQLSKKRRSPIFRDSHGDWRLTPSERKRVLLDHIYGVDIDSQAVEVTKLSLLLKVLEGENEEALETQRKLFHERALPDLDSNIKCGNSLIGPDFYDNVQMTLLDEEEQYRINVFDWKKEFADVFKGENPGFDAVMGNPPYIRIQSLNEWAPQEVQFYKSQYKSGSKGNFDIYVLFVERGLQLLNDRGHDGFILPHKFFNAKYGEPLRDVLASGQHLSLIVHFGHQQLFAGATNYTCLLFLEKRRRHHFKFAKVDDLVEWRNTGKAAEGIIPASSVTAAEWNFIVGEGADLFDKLGQIPLKLENVTSRIFQGIKTSADKIYIIEELEREPRRVRVYCREKEAEYWLEPDLLHPLVKGGDSKRYSLARTNRLILFPYGPRQDGETVLIPEAPLKADYPLTWAYLIENKAYLESRENGKMRGSRWYGYVYPKSLDVISLPKIFTPDIAANASFSLDPTGKAFFTGGVAGGYGILVSPDYSREYILGLLNAKLSEWFIRQSSTQMRGGYLSFEARFIRNLPIRPIDFKNPADRKRHDRMVELVDHMLDLHKRLAKAKTPHEKDALQRQIDATDRQIDLLVYELYELTEEEIKIVEGENQ